MHTNLGYETFIAPGVLAQRSKPEEAACNTHIIIMVGLLSFCSVAFGMRKALQAEQGKADMERKVSLEMFLNI